jgi:SAM-dependent methyltransferase
LQDGVESRSSILRHSTLRDGFHAALTGHARQTKTPAAFGEADAALEATLLSLEGAHNYNAWIYSLLRPHLGDEVLEIGAGHGTFTELMSGRRRLVVTDLSERCVAVLRDRYGDADGIEIYQADIEESIALGSFDSIVLVNVLEHIKDDLTAMKHLARGLKPGGRLLLWVPASPRLYSEFDRRIGHYRRYGVEDLASLAQAVGLEVRDIRHVNLVGALAWWLLARQLRRTPTKEGGVRLYDTVFVPIMQRLEARWRPPFGQSIFSVAARPQPNL